MGNPFLDQLATKMKEKILGMILKICSERIVYGILGPAQKGNA